MLNTGHLSVESCAEVLADAAASATLAETPESRKLLEDKLLQARVAEVLQHPDLKHGYAPGVQSWVRDGEVGLYGAVVGSGLTQEIESLVRQVSGVRSVHNEITALRSYSE